jgi:hypothetical protein
MLDYKIATAMLMATGALTMTNPSRAAGVLAASAGFADDTTKASCFQRDYANPGQVRYTCSSPVGAWWDIPLPISSTGSKTLSVYFKSSWGGIFTNECDAMVMAANGTIA